MAKKVKVTYHSKTYYYNSVHSAQLAWHFSPTFIRKQIKKRGYGVTSHGAKVSFVPPKILYLLRNRSGSYIYDDLRLALSDMGLPENQLKHVRDTLYSGGVISDRKGNRIMTVEG